jgi:ribosome-binding protein aMBF1 (putative translation factor)
LHTLATARARPARTTSCQDDKKVRDDDPAADNEADRFVTELCDRRIHRDERRLPVWFWPHWLSRRSITGSVTALSESFGANVRAARRRKGWTQEDLSGKAGLAVVQISRIERGTREVRLTTIVRLLDALEVSADELFAGLHASDST